MWLEIWHETLLVMRLFVVRVLDPWFGWLLLALGIGGVFLSTIFYDRYLEAQKRIWAGIPAIRERLDIIKPTLLRKSLNAIGCLAMAASGVLWLWLRR